MGRKNQFRLASRKIESFERECRFPASKATKAKMRARRTGFVLFRGIVKTHKKAWPAEIVRNIRQCRGRLAPGGLNSTDAGNSGEKSNNHEPNEKCRAFNLEPPDRQVPSPCSDSHVFSPIHAAGSRGNVRRYAPMCIGAPSQQPCDLYAA